VETGDEPTGLSHLSQIRHDFRFESLADVARSNSDVRFTPMARCRIWLWTNHLPESTGGHNLSCMQSSRKSICFHVCIRRFFFALGQKQTLIGAKRMSAKCQ